MTEAALRLGRPEQLSDPDERLLAETVGRLAADGELGDDAYAAAVALLGERGLFELTTLVGYYSTLALQLRVFRVETQY